MVEKIKNKRKKILITGAAGMLGTALSEELSGEYAVTGQDLIEAENSVTCDITNAQDVLKCVLSAKPDFIIHTAAWTDVDGCEKDVDKATKVNAIGTKNVSTCASKLGIPLLYISTDFVFDGKKTSPYTENDQVNPINVYGRSKLDGEKNAGTLDRTIIIRSCWLYGANGKNFVDVILKRAKSEKQLSVVDDQIGSPTYVKDLARAIKSLLDLDKISGIYNISNRGTVSWFDYAKEILAVAGIDKVEVLPIKAKDLARPARRPEFSVLDNSKFEKITGFKMRPWKEALREYINER